MKLYFRKIGKVLLLLTVFFAGSVLLLTAGTYLYLSPKLPSAEKLRTVKLQTPLQIFSHDHRLIGEFGEKRRNPVTFDEIPQDFINAILAAEDDRFYEHGGVDIQGLLRAASELIISGHIQSGGSTITMQVARNFFLSTEQSFIRKFNEILLALRIEDELSKDEILTLYANKIYLGNRAYGVEAAANVYYGTSIDQLALDQQAMIAGLPKAPSAYNPLANPQRATARRNWILNRMHKLKLITKDQLDIALNTVDTASYHNPVSELNAPYIAEMARQKVIDSWGLDAYTEGYIVTTTVDSALQISATQAVRTGLDDYDWRHGYRGAEKTIADPDAWPTTLRATSTINKRQPAIVTNVSKEQVQLLLANGEAGQLDLGQNSDIRKFISEDRRSARINDFTELLQTGDLIRIIRHPEGHWQLTQIPKAQAALVALDPENGAIRALVGGYDFYSSHFNRADQAIRQPGSNFKPFIYTRALEKGMSAATLINDAPVVFRDPNLEKVWRPENDSGKFYGPTPLRKALYLSRNLVSIRILRQIGINYAIAGMSRFGFDEDSLPKNLSLALGTQGTTPLAIAQGYTAFANGGYKVNAHLIEKVETINGDVIYEANPATVCRNCDDEAQELEEVNDIFEEADSLQQLFAQHNPNSPEPPAASSASSGADTAKAVNSAERIIDARIAFVMDSILRDVIKKGTGRKALVLKRGDIGGKTGTTNGPRDAWFSGYSPHLVTTVWVGFDENLLLGRNEYGGSAALPIWIDFMGEALKGKPEIHRPQPPGLITVRINPETGARVRPGDPSGVYEYFLNDQKTPKVIREQTPGHEEGAPLPEELF
jgi:penicillin-binding protein 1A